MSTVLKHGLIYTGSEKIVDGYLRFDKQIINVGPMSEYKAQVSDDKIIDLEGQVVVPGFIDVHSHGGYSFDSMDGDANQIDEMVNDMVHEGITTYFATTMTQSHENIAHAMVGIKEAAAKIQLFKVFILKDLLFHLFSKELNQKNISNLLISMLSLIGMNYLVA